MTIASVGYLCHACGACAAVCPCRAISYRETVGGYLFPRIDQNQCTQCGLCLDVCPGVHFGRRLKEKWPDDPFVGVARECYLGRAEDKEVHAGAQSGGVVTALLLDALHQKLVQGAVVAVMIPGRSPKIESIIATSRQEILAARKSKYAPVPLLRDLMETIERGMTVAVVGLPCHLHGLENLLDNRPELERFVPLRIGLICDRVMTMAGLDFLAARSGLKGDLRELRFRDKSTGEWPGDVKVISASGRSAVVPSRVRLNIKDAFTPARCRLCFDKMNVFADITVGDPWGINSSGTVDGECVVIARTGFGSGLVKEAIRREAVILSSIHYEEIVRGQSIEERRRNWRGYYEAWQALGGKPPDYGARIAGCISAQMCLSAHARNLRRSLELDRFRSRPALLQYLSISLFLQDCRRLFSPVRLAGSVLRRIRQLGQKI